MYEADAGLEAVVDSFARSHASRRVYPRGTELLQPQRLAGTVMLLRQGLVKHVHVGPGGREHIIGLTRPVSLLGAADLVACHPLNVATVAASPCEVDEIDAEQFVTLLREDSQLLWTIFTHIARVLCDAITDAIQVRALQPRDRLKWALGLFVASGNGGQTRNVRLSIPIMHREVAQFIGVTPPHLSRLLHEFERDGLIRRSRGWIIVRDLNSLASSPDRDKHLLCRHPARPSGPRAAPSPPRID